MPSIAIILVMVAAILATTQAQQQQDNTTVDEIGASTVEIIRSRGFLAKAFNFTSKQGIIFNVVRVNNPEINRGQAGGLANKSVVLMVHGLLTNSQNWVVNSVGARPKNYGHLSAANMSRQQLEDLLGDDPTSNSFCLTLVNFGHECWIYDRRGTTASQRHTSELNRTLASSNNRRKRQVNQEQPANLANATLASLESIRLDLGQLANTVDAPFWNYSYDEQGSEDLPQVFEFVIEQTNCKSLSLLGYSAGGLVTTIALADGRLSRDQLRHVMLWAPAVELGHDKSNLIILGAPLVEPLLVAYLGPIGPSLLNRIIMALGGVVCAPEATKSLVCAQLLLDVLGGYGGDQQKVEPGFVAAFPEVTNGHELAQLASAAHKLKMDHFDYLLPVANRRQYGQDQPPTYNISPIDVPSLSLWYGNRDTLVTPADNRDLLARFSTKVESHFINDTGLLFNHFSFVLHKQVARYLTIPALQTMERYDRSSCSM